MPLPPDILTFLRGAPLRPEQQPALRRHLTAARYVADRVLGEGATAEVHQVWDPVLERVVALKLQREAAGAAAARAFTREARVLCRLDHPGVLPLLDAGETPDGRAWFTLPVVGGQGLDARIAALHAQEGEEGLWGLVSAFLRAVEAVAHAHGRGVIHRDLKPANLRLDAQGAVRVLDWGFASMPEEAELDTDGLIGSPAWMAPEAAQGEPATPATDVFGLGAILFALLTGRPPFVGPTLGATLRLARAGAVGELGASPFVARGLQALCASALQRQPEDRPDAERFAAGLVSWLDGGRRSKEARALVTRAVELRDREEGLWARAEALRAQARRSLQALPPWCSSEEKAAAWATEDAALQASREASALVHQQIEGLQAALRLDPELAEAHGALATVHRQLADRAETRGEAAEAEHHIRQVRAYDRGAHRAWLEGTGVLTLITDPPGAEVRWATFVVDGRRLVPRPMGALGQTPLREVPLPPGSHLLTISHPACETVLYPVHLSRAGHWHGVAPGETAPRPVRLPARGGLALSEVYVPGGWTVHGGDPEAADPAPLRRVWVEPFVIDRHPVTFGAWVERMNLLEEAGEGALAAALCPAEGVERQGARWGLRPFGTEIVNDPGLPVVSVSYRQCLDFLQAEGGTHRLPTSLEWEKAGRGVDGRPFVWGSFADPSWAVVLEHHRGRPAPLPIGAAPADRSLYGVCGLQGGARTWCGDLWSREGDALEATDPNPWIHVRGGAWNARQAITRLASRFAARQEMTFLVLGLRRARSFPFTP